MCRKFFIVMLLCAVLHVVTHAQQAISLGNLINSPLRDETSPMISADEQMLIFAADTKGGTAWRIMASYRVGDSAWSEPQYIENVNRTSVKWDFFGAPFLTYDNNTLYFSSNRAGGAGSIDVWYSQRQGKNWTNATNLTWLNTAGYEGFVSVSPNGKTMYFMRTTGDKRYQIFATHNHNGAWSTPKALPAPINTSNDKYPRISADGKTLIWSSDRAGGKGNFDLYLSRLNDDSTWAEPLNLSFINTAGNDALVSIPASGNKMYFSSDAAGSFDLYVIEIPADFRPYSTILVSGTITDSLTRQPMQANITITKTNNSSVVATLQSNADGKYVVTLNNGVAYDFAVSAKGYTFASELFEQPLNAPSVHVTRNITLAPLTRGTTVRLNNILFAPDSWSLSNEAMPELERVAQLLNDNPNLTIEISAHTDDNGDANYNLQLSQRRADAVLRYLVKQKNIPPARAKANGYGETQPLVANDSDANKALNRRVQFVVLDNKQ